MVDLLQQEKIPQQNSLNAIESQSFRGVIILTQFGFCLSFLFFFFVRSPFVSDGFVRRKEKRK